MKKCMYCSKELGEESVVDVCTSCGHGVWGEQMFNAIKEIVQVLDVVEIENRFRNPTVLGWRDVTMLVAIPLPDGVKHIAEVQFQLMTFTRARSEAHT